MATITGLGAVEGLRFAAGRRREGGLGRTGGGSTEEDWFGLEGRIGGLGFA